MAIIDGLQSYWKLDEASGDAIDAHGSNDLTNTNVTYGETGKINDCYGYDGDDTSIGDAIGDIDNISWSCWAQTTNNELQQVVTADSNDVATVRIVGPSWESYLPSFVVYIGASWYAVSGNAQLSTNTWYHLVGTYDGETVKMYINGTLQTDQNTDPSADCNVLGNAHLGVHANTWSHDLQGLLDEVGVWNRALTQAEVTELYNSGNGLAYPFAAGGTNIQLNIGDSWKDVDSAKINIGDAWKEAASMKINIGDSWKEIF